MKRRSAIISAVLLLIFIVGCLGDSRCGSRRFPASNIDERINSLKERIATLEKEKVKDSNTAFRLADAYNQLGLIYLDRKLWDSAVDSFHQCLKNGSTTASIYYSLGLAYANRGKTDNNAEDFDKAEKNYRRAIELQANHYDARYALSILLFYHLDDKKEAVTLLEDNASENNKHYLSRFALAKFYYELNKLDRSLDIYQELYDDVEKLPDSEVSREYKKYTKDNINILMAELSQGKSE